MVQLQSLPTTFTLLIDSSQSLHRRIDMVKAAARRLATRLRSGDRVIVAPFKTTVESTTGPTDDGQTIADAIGAIKASGGTAILDALKTLPISSTRSKAGTSWCCSPTATTRRARRPTPRR